MSQPSGSPTTSPAWMRYWLALLPPVYVLSPLALLGLPFLRTLPRTALWLLGFYALSQQLPALFTPEPLLASALALARTLLLLGLIGLGAALQDSGKLRPLGVGVGVVLLTAFVQALTSGLDFFMGRLTHPYMTSSSLGLAGAVGVWLACFLQGAAVWRLPLGLLSVAGVLISGSRGGLVALLVGCAAGFIIQRGRRLALLALAGIALLSGVFMLGERLNLSFMTRLTTADTTGRDIVWSNTLSVIQAYPWAGVGSYRLGHELAPPGNPCTFFSAPDGGSAACPAMLERVGSPWLIAHNVTLQQLAETGPLGLLGLMALLGAVVYVTATRRDALGMAVVAGLLVGNISDNTTLVPSPFFAEVFWLVAGIQLRYLTSLSARSGLVAAGVAVLLSAPLIGVAFSSRPEQSVAALRMFSAASVVPSSRDYTVLFMPDLPPGRYRAALKSCDATCVTIASVSFWQAQKPALLKLGGNLRNQPSQTLTLQLLNGKSSFSVTPLAERHWQVKVKQVNP